MKDRPHVIGIQWFNPYTSPPSDVETLPDGVTLWACSVLARDHLFDQFLWAEHAPQVIPGSGWSRFWSMVPAPVKRWSPERKAATRKARLRARLDHHAPLFADLLYEAELARTPQYFDAAAIAAGEDMIG